MNLRFKLSSNRRGIWKEEVLVNMLWNLLFLISRGWRNHRRVRLLRSNQMKKICRLLLWKEIVLKMQCLLSRSNRVKRRMSWSLSMNHYWVWSTLIVRSCLVPKLLCTLNFLLSSSIKNSMLPMKLSTKTKDLIWTNKPSTTQSLYPSTSIN